MIQKFGKSMAESRGVVLIFSVLMIGILLSAVMSLYSIFVVKIRPSAQAKRSVPALFAAESALEWCLYAKKISPAPPPALPVMNNGATYLDGNGGAVTSSDCSPATIKIIGNYQSVTRAFEISI